MSFPSIEDSPTEVLFSQLPATITMAVDQKHYDNC